MCDVLKLDEDGLQALIEQRLFSLRFDVLPLEEEERPEDAFVEAFKMDDGDFNDRLTVAVVRTLGKAHVQLLRGEGNRIGPALERLFRLILRTEMEHAVPAVAGLIYSGTLLGHPGAGLHASLHVAALDVLASFPPPRHLHFDSVWTALLDRRNAAEVAWKAVLKAGGAAQAIQVLPRLVRTHLRDLACVDLHEALTKLLERSNLGPQDLHARIIERLGSVEPRVLEALIGPMTQVLRQDAGPLDAMLDFKHALEILAATDLNSGNPFIQVGEHELEKREFCRFVSVGPRALERFSLPRSYVNLQSDKRQGLLDLLELSERLEDERKQTRHAVWEMADKVGRAVRQMLEGEERSVPSDELRWLMVCGEMEQMQPQRILDICERLVMSDDERVRSAPSVIAPVLKLRLLSQQAMA